MMYSWTSIGLGTRITGRLTFLRYIKFMIFELGLRFTGKTPFPVPKHRDMNVVHNFHSLGTHLPLVIIPTGMDNPEWSSITVESRRCLDVV